MADTPESPQFGVKFVKDRYEQGLASVRSELQDYWVNHAYLMGHQWLFYNTQNQRLDEMPRDPDRVQATINRLRANTRTIMSKFMQREMTYEVLPNAADDATVRGARIAESAIRSTAAAHNWETLREMAGYAAWKGGSAALFLDWDPQAGVQVGEVKGRPVYTGDTKESLASIAEFVVEPGARDAETARWVIRAQALPPGEVMSTYRLDKMPAADATAGLSAFQSKLLLSGVGHREDSPNLTLVLTYLERPNPQTPKGRYAVIVGDEMVFGPNPWPFPWKDHLNFVLIRETPNETRWPGNTILTQAIPVQTAYNASWSSIIEHLKLAGNARLFLPQSAIDMIEQLSDLPGEVVPYPDGTEPPQWQAPPQMPGWVIQQPEKLALEMDDIMGVHAVSRGSAPVNIESGYGLSVLAEEDSSPIGRLLKETAHAFGKLGSMVLKLKEQMVVQTDKAIVRTPGQAAESVEYTGKDLQGQTDVTVPLDAILPRSRAAQQAMADKLLQMGVIASFDQYARVAELPDQFHLTEAINPDIAKARRENALMAQGQVQLPAEIDEHVTHMAEHRTFMKSPRFANMSVEEQQVYYDHVQAHETMMVQTIARQRARAAIDPALGAMPDRTGAPALPPELAAPFDQASATLPGPMSESDEGEMPEGDEPPE